MEIFTNPWPHIIIDDFLPEDELTMRYNQARKWTSAENDKPCFNYDPLEGHDFEQYLEYLPHRPYSRLEKMVHYARTPLHFRHELHCDIESKVLSAILYLGPDENYGTGLYRENNIDSLVKTSEWKPNRMFIFCGMSGVTWHDFTSNHLDRYTLNWFLVNAEHKKSDAFAY